MFATAVDMFDAESAVVLFARVVFATAAVVFGTKSTAGVGDFTTNVVLFAEAEVTAACW